MNQRFSEGIECPINIRVSLSNRMTHQTLTAILKGQIPFLAVYKQIPKLAEFYKFTKLVESGNFGTGSYKKFDQSE